MRSKKWISAALTACLCASGPAAAAGGPAVSGSPGVIECPSQDFHLFLKVYAESRTLQELFVADPLKWQQVDSRAQPEPRRVVRQRSRLDIRFPVLPPEAERTSRKLSLSVPKVDGDTASVVLSRPDTDHQVTYLFQRRSCWQLVEVDDASL
jgi:hypothetical protein